jgi:hypothetical protein
MRHIAVTILPVDKKTGLKEIRHGGSGGTMVQPDPLPNA